MKHPSYKISAALMLASLPGFMNAQIILTDWHQSWTSFHPVAGVLPAEAGLNTPHPRTRHLGSPQKPTLLQATPGPHSL